MPSLSDRLLKIASFINKGERVADIGTDHAYLPIYLRQSGISPSVLACDIKSGPLSVAKKNVTLSGTDGVAFRLCDGLSGLSPDEADVFVIAGMGGELIANILARCEWAQGSGKRFILQPMNSPEYLREFLSRNGYTIADECAVRDADRVYTVISVLATRDDTEHDERYFFVGRLDCAREDDLFFLKKQYLRLSSCAFDLEKTENREQYLYYKRAADYISEYIGV
ncbi:MAG: SAM-dependent methyltransferase [Clostridia bacterium]|nr:SAM-dependent methyltransferase [Clostridia bacterium]